MGLAYKRLVLASEPCASGRGRRNGGWETLAAHTPRRRRWGCPVNYRVALTTQAAASVDQTRIFYVLASEPCSLRARATELGPTEIKSGFGCAAELKTQACRP